MVGNEKDKLVKSIQNYFRPQNALQVEAQKLKQERLDQEENEKVEPNQKVEPPQNE